MLSAVVVKPHFNRVSIRRVKDESGERTKLGLHNLEYEALRVGKNQLNVRRQVTSSYPVDYLIYPFVLTCALCVANEITLYPRRHHRSTNKHSKSVSIACPQPLPATLRACADANRLSVRTSSEQYESTGTKHDTLEHQAAPFHARTCYSHAFLSTVSSGEAFRRPEGQDYYSYTPTPPFLPLFVWRFVELPPMHRRQ